MNRPELQRYLPATEVPDVENEEGKGSMLAKAFTVLGFGYPPEEQWTKKSPMHTLETVMEVEFDASEVATLQVAKRTLRKAIDQERISQRALFDAGANGRWDEDTGYEGAEGPLATGIVRLGRLNPAGLQQREEGLCGLPRLDPQVAGDCDAL